MDPIIYGVAGLLELVGPIAGYTWALRAGRSRGQIVLAAAMGGVFAGFVLAFPLVRDGGGVVGLMYIAISAISGLFIGFAGLIARGIGEWLSRRP